MRTFARHVSTIFIRKVVRVESEYRANNVNVRELLGNGKASFLARVLFPKKYTLGVNFYHWDKTNTRHTQVVSRFSFLGQFSNYSKECATIPSRNSLSSLPEYVHVHAKRVCARARLFSRPFRNKISRILFHASGQWPSSRFYETNFFFCSYQEYQAKESIESASLSSVPSPRWWSPRTTTTVFLSHSEIKREGREGLQIPHVANNRLSLSGGRSFMSIVNGGRVEHTVLPRLSNRKKERSNEKRIRPILQLLQRDFYNLKKSLSARYSASRISFRPIFIFFTMMKSRRISTRARVAIKHKNAYPYIISNKNWLYPIKIFLALFADWRHRTRNPTLGASHEQTVS